ncbi:PelD GGDEF domain-containing protein [Legionella waltersii]|uniref:PelD GGDEF domain-containing protein n=1 Tax=Legionella waltersii TaxID=66969 RepID=A0A0W1A4J1_9GAMM|nr:PelD GGDEF domain-containing protein [Legionella waltersii]KTD76290.1 hypothetical protein Lwal_2012 [Legionella waltersii]SNV13462.1 Uncharacterised protein [Legionella waltersii]
MKFEKDFALVYFKRRENKRMLIETIIASLVVGIFVFFLGADNPFSFRTDGFPWMILFPMFFALFYNTSFGLLSLAILWMIYGFKPDHLSIATLPMQEYIVGSFSVTALAGLFSTYWQRVISHDEHLNDYLRNHLEDLSKDYYLLKLSHERLEHAYITKPLSFRGAIHSLKSELAGDSMILNQETGLKLLTISSQYCLISNAILVLRDPQTNTLSQIASLGMSFELNTNDPLVQEVINTGTTHFVAVNQLSSHFKSEYLAVIPLLDDEKKTVGLTVIKDMPFWLLTEENMTALSVFASVIMLHMPYSNKILDLFSLFPHMEQGFLRELYLLRKLKKYHNIDSVLSALVVPVGAYQEQIVYGLKQSVRSLDYIVTLPYTDKVFVVMLLPLTPIAGAYGYESRLEEWIKNEFGLKLYEKGLLFRYRMLNSDKAYVQLQQFIEELSNECN